MGNYRDPSLLPADHMSFVGGDASSGEGGGGGADSKGCWLEGLSPGFFFSISHSDVYDETQT